MGSGTCEKQQLWYYLFGIVVVTFADRSSAFVLLLFIPNPPPPKLVVNFSSAYLSFV